ncbi:hypothetical protein TRVL_10257 [Trypanosoma vivax]|nr:hypothetical protein TRVL_10257 [Trypanosoma vivax]
MFFSDAFAPGRRRSEAMLSDQELGLGPTMAPRSRCWRRWGVARSKARAFMGGPFFAPLRFRGAKAAGNARFGFAFFGFAFLFEANGDAAGSGFFRRKTGMPSAKLGFVDLFCRRFLLRPNGEAPRYRLFKGDRFGDLGKWTRSPSRRFPKIAMGLRCELLAAGCEALSLPEAAIKGARGFRFSSEAKCAGRRSERAVANFRDTSQIGERPVVGWAFRRSFCVPCFVPRSAEVLLGRRGAPGANFEKTIFPVREKKEKRKEQQEKGQRASNK